MDPELDALAGAGELPGTIVVRVERDLERDLSRGGDLICAETEDLS